MVAAGVNRVSGERIIGANDRTTFNCGRNRRGTQSSFDGNNPVDYPALRMETGTQAAGAIAKVTLRRVVSEVKREGEKTVCHFNDGGGILLSNFLGGLFAPATKSTSLSPTTLPGQEPKSTSARSHPQGGVVISTRLPSVMPRSPKPISESDFACGQRFHRAG